MAHPSLLPSLLTLFLLLISSTQPHSATSDSFSPSSPFISAVRSTIDEVQKVLSILSTVAGPFGDSRISNAVNDCVDLLDFSSDELSWTISSTSAATTTGDRHSDLKSWLSAALGNQDTCLDGFDGTDGLVKSLVAQGLQTVTSLVGQALQMSGQFASGSRKLLSTTVRGFPEWVSAGDRRLMQAPASGVQADAVVAADGSGTYKTVTEAVEAAPVESTKRYVIYVKRGIYKENVDIKKKKWNLMLIGDGMDATIITGDRSFVDGWTTFRSATFGE
ncbi:hypothetical protein QJS04_geneDACA013599 [Acorus gramineus]|uniref:Pectinesterase n=1 Tax=Acorus gramineus TaxID=55184 RepID=A0AAV9AIJ9_ACOGR|nr:hypothetical protein QJS04_geneDACA013599 [Acorus gramineus]